MVKRDFEDLEEYGREDLAMRHRSTAGSQAEADPDQLAELKRF